MGQGNFHGISHGKCNGKDREISYGQKNIEYPIVNAIGNPKIFPAGNTFGFLVGSHMEYH